MKPRLLEILECPACGKADFETREERGEDSPQGRDVVEGSLRCRGCSKEYPIKDSIVFFEISQAEDGESPWNEVFKSRDDAAIQADIERTRRNVDSGMAAQGSLASRLLAREDLPIESYLEIGCGGGFFAWYNHSVRPGMRQILLDYAVGAVIRARATYRLLGLDADFVQGNGMRLPFKSGSITASSTSGLLEHFQRDQMLTILNEQARVCRYNFCQAPIDTAAYWLLRRYVTWRLGKWPFGYEVPLKGKFWDELLRDTGWKPRAVARQSLFTAFSLHVLRIRFKPFYRLTRFTENLASYDECRLCEKDR